MIVFIEPLGKPYSHLAVVNALLFSELQKKNKEQILFISSLEYFRSIPFEYRDAVQFEEIKIRNSSLFNIIDIVLIILSFLLKYRKVSDLKIYLLFSKSYSNLILKILSFIILSKRKRIYTLIHGELQNIVLKGNLPLILDGLVQRFLYWLDSRFYSNFRLVIISEFVHERLTKHLKFYPRNLICIDLPYLYVDKIELKEQTKNKLIISTVGVNSEMKNSHFLNEIAWQFRNEIYNGILEVCVTGRNDGVKFNDLIKIPDLRGNYLLSPEEYADSISKTDVLIFFNDDKYDLISSGSYFDCINFKKPIIALKNAQWEYNFQKFGNIGYLCNNIGEINGHIKMLLNDKSSLGKFHISLEGARAQTSVTEGWPLLLSKLK